ncbi:hypothetical protein ATCC90586_003988 [Pythium insidiosum]|nr:hypothetical protein ATCC90586_003988 [Pythium insidiosum]
MSRRLTAAMMPELELSEEDVQELKVLGSELRHEVLMQYEDFLFNQQRQVDKSRWKFVRSQEDVHVYRERDDVKAGDRSFDPLGSDSRTRSTAMEIGPMAAMAANSDMPVMMVTGTVPGTVDDARYGSTFHDTATLRQRSVYQNEYMEDCAVLQVIEPPSHEEPFDFMGVIWYLKSFPFSSVMRSRDSLTYCHMHSTSLRSGERVGINLYHSIQHRALPEFSDMNVLRAQVSLVVIFRQLEPQKVEIFMMNFLDPLGHLSEMIVVPEASKTLLAITNTCDTAQRRKLRWLVRERRRQLLKDRQTPGYVEPESSDCCVVCEKQLGGIFSSSGTICQVCRERVCSRCTVPRKLVLSASSMNLDMKAIDFCLACTMEVKRIPAREVAQRELEEQQYAARESRVLRDSDDLLRSISM